ncbi:MAG TPA: LamG domain-containing protein, partial [Solirubrobacteraceae bacterium]|nr:LamG domain-containing protein [Solirubrobacteraceae bacterium]
MRRALAALVLAAAVVAPAPASADHSVLAGQWHLDESEPFGDGGPESGPAADSSGHGIHGQRTRVLPVAGMFGGAFAFDGSSSQVEIPAATSVLEPPRLSVVTWVRSTDAGQGGYRYVAAKGDGDCRGASWAFYTGRGAAAGGLSFYVWDGVVDDLAGSWTDSPTVQAGEIWDGEWHAVTGTFDGSTVRLFVDGAEVGSGVPQPAPIAYGLPERRMMLGRSARDSCANHWNGSLDEFRVYNRALT